MTQTTVIVGIVIVAFVIFITTRGELPTYLSFITGTAAQPPASTVSPTSIIGGLGALKSLLTPEGQ